MRLGICDDEEYMRKRLRKVCEAIIEEKGWDFEIVEFATGEEVLAEKEPLELLVLDVELPGVNGIEVKEELQRRRAETIITYITFYDRYMRDAFGVKVNGFVNKYDLEEKLPQMLAKAMRLMGKSICLDNGIQSKDILYIRADHIYVNIVLRNGDCVVSRKTLSELEKKLSCVDFIQTHKSYLVNLQWAHGWNNKYMILQSDFGDIREEVPIAWRREDEVKKLYTKYVMKTEFG